jgi:hypothetical protein
MVNKNRIIIAQNIRLYEQLRIQQQVMTCNRKKQINKYTVKGFYKIVKGFAKVTAANTQN